MSLSPEVAPVRAGERLQWLRLEAWLRPRLAEVLPGVDGPLDVLQFPNGSANLTYLLRVGTHELVLRRPPMGQIAPGAHDMKREFKVLSVGLWKTVVVVQQLHRRWVRGESTDPRMANIADRVPALIAAAHYVLDGDARRT
jgi:hypothetical protein